MDKKITFLAKFGLILAVIGSIFRFYNEPFGNYIFVCSTLVILPAFFILNLIRELRVGEESKTSVFIYFLGVNSLLCGLGFKILKYNFGVNFFLISMGLFSLFLLINGLKKIKESKKNIFHYIIYPIVFFFVILSLKFYFLNDLNRINVWFHLSLALVFMIALSIYVILQVNVIRKTGFQISNYNQLKLMVLLIPLVLWILVKFHHSVPIGTQSINKINLALLQEENENQVVLGNSLITDKNKAMVSKLDMETQKVIKKLDSIKLDFLNLNDEKFSEKIKKGRVKLTAKIKDKLMPLSVQISDIIYPSTIIERKNYNYPYELSFEYRKKIIQTLFPKLNNLGNFYYDFEYIKDANDLKSKIIRISKNNNLTNEEQKLLLLILMKDTHKGNVDYYDIYYDYKNSNFEYLTITSAIEILSKIQNEILSTRTLIISNL